MIYPLEIIRKHFILRKSTREYRKYRKNLVK